MFITVISDCRDGNAVGRQLTRYNNLTGIQPTFVPVETGFGAAGELEAAGNLIDMLDAAEGGAGVVVVNVAPRSGSGKRWPNGTPFGWFKYNNTIVLASVAGYTLSLAKKLGILTPINVFDIPTVMQEMVSRGTLADTTAQWITSTQFRSFDFLPRATAWLIDGTSLPTTELAPTEIPDVGARVWIIDNFGNCKTTMLQHELAGKSSLETSIGTFRVFERLKDVPEGELGAIVGSSGLPGQRFVELVIQGRSLSAEKGIRAGDEIV